MWKSENPPSRSISWSSLRQRGFHKTSLSISVVRQHIDARTTRDTDIAILSVRLFVRHVPLFYENGLTLSYFPHHT